MLKWRGRESLCCSIAPSGFESWRRPHLLPSLIAPQRRDAKRFGAPIVARRLAASAPKAATVAPLSRIQSGWITVGSHRTRIPQSPGTVTHRTGGPNETRRAHRTEGEGGAPARVRSWRARGAQKSSSGGRRMAEAQARGPEYAACERQGEGQALHRGRHPGYLGGRKGG
jgi:hypothetical protein